MVQVQRWYKGYKSKKKPEELIEKVSQKVQEYHLSRYIPLLRIEKGARARREYCFFLAIESETKGKVPDQVIESNLLELPFFHFSVVPGNPNFTYKEIQSMVGVAHKVEDYTNPIPYQVTEKRLDDNPFGLSLSIAESRSNHREVRSERNQKFLYWLSTVGNGTWELFKKACQELELNSSQSILRRLKLLGYIETSSDGKRWSITPTALVQIKSCSHNQEFILCGQQNGKLLEEFRKTGNVKLINQLQVNAPPCVQLQFNNSLNIEQLIDKIQHDLGITIYQAGYAAEKLAEALPELVEWKSYLRSLPGIVKSCYNWKYFKDSDFVEWDLPQQTGMYQMWERDQGNQGNHPRLTLFYEAETDTWRQGDWYGLRFLALQYSNTSCIAWYEPDTLRLGIPRTQRWPELYERALVLASGLLPEHDKTGQNVWLIYENISADLVKKLTQKLQVSCKEVETYV